MATADYTCFECGRDHGPKKNFWDRCPFKGRPRQPRPVPIRPTDEQRRHDAPLEARIARDIAARQQREVDEKAERQRAKTSALLTDLRREYRAARQAEGEAIRDECRAVLAPIEFVEGLANRRLAQRLLVRFGPRG
jgi:hypothetical protein